MRILILINNLNSKIFKKHWFNKLKEMKSIIKIATRLRKMLNASQLNKPTIIKHFTRGIKIILSPKTRNKTITQKYSFGSHIYISRLLIMTSSAHIEIQKIILPLTDSASR